MRVQPAQPVRFIAIWLAAIVLLVGGSYSVPKSASSVETSYLVQSANVRQAEEAVLRAGGTVTQQLAIINGIVANLNPQAVARLRLNAAIVLHENKSVQASGLPEQVVEAPNTDPLRGPGGPNEGKTKGYWLYPSAATGAKQLHTTTVPTADANCVNQRVTVTNTQQAKPLQGYGVTVAFVDSGFAAMKNAKNWINRNTTTGVLQTEFDGRCMVYRDFLPRTAANGNSGSAANNSIDQNGHGTHVIATVADYRAVQMADNEQPASVGVAPQVNLMIARALDKDGSGTYASVISAIDWVIQNKDTYNVRVLNLSLYAPVTGPYWADPLNQAVMKAWQAGIVVVAAAGNNGSNAGTITVPGDVPYVITVGAIKSGRYTQSGYDELATYSSRGPTESAFVKPDLLVPASQTIAPIPNSSLLAKQIPAAAIKDKANMADSKGGDLFEQTTYYRLSGTSMAAAEVSGIVALVLQSNPTLTNDQVKYRLMATTAPAVDLQTGQPALTPWEQGAGMVDVQLAAAGTTSERANEAMNITTDLTTDTHYWGYSTWDQGSNSFILIDSSTGQQQAVWDGGSRLWSGGSRLWSGGSRLWSGGSRLWSGGSRLWSGGSRLWSGSDSLWAGNNRIWAGSTPTTSLNTAAQTEPLINP